MRWIKWSEKNTVPFEARLNVDKPKNYGNGEHKLAQELGASVDTDRLCDILWKDTKVEVKELGNFRCTMTSDMYVQKVHDRIYSVAHQLQGALNEVSYDSELAARVADIATCPYLSIGKVKGISFKNGTERVGLLQVCEKLLEDYTPTPIRVYVNGNVLRLTAASYYRMARDFRFKISHNDCDVRKIDKIYSYLTDSMFEYGHNQLASLWDSVRPSDVLLNHADLLCIVDKERGWMVLNRSMVDDAVIFQGFSKGDVKFRTVNSLKKAGDYLQFIKDNVVERNTISR